ncbi:uncharacterized protein METZ01_LOCUS23609 [marine metagenome]|uniref:Uncharacterized protein n=1 Tax=marine metagenome TaxID=408172 RepID=A0A381PUP7_9ZZZZ
MQKIFTAQQFPAHGGILHGIDLHDGVEHTGDVSAYGNDD